MSHTGSEQGAGGFTKSMVIVSDYDVAACSTGIQTGTKPYWSGSIKLLLVDCAVPTQFDANVNLRVLSTVYYYPSEYNAAIA